MAVTWIEPKTDWNAETDRFNIEDYNRIKNNLEYLHEKAVQLYHSFSIIDMGEDAEYPDFWDVNKFNAFEQNLNTINQHVYTRDFGASQTFYPNGIFIQAGELNRIESATLRMKQMFDGQENALQRLSFRLGAYKSIRT